MPNRKLPLIVRPFSKKNRPYLHLELLEDRTVPTAGGMLSGVVFEDLDGDGLRETGEPAMADTRLFLDVNDDGIRQVPTLLEPDDFPSGTLLNEISAAVTLQTVDGAGDGAFFGSNVIGRDSTSASTGSLVFTPSSFGWSSSQRLEMSFTDPVSYVSLDLTATAEPASVRLEIYAVDETLIDSVEVSGLSAGEVQVLNLSSAAADIARAVAWPTAGDGHFDRLQFGVIPEPTTVTDTSGAYSFTGLAAGDYVVRQIVPDMFTQTAPDGDGTFRVVLAEEQTIADLHFGNQSLLADIYGTVVTGDAPSQSGLEGVTVYLDVNDDGQFLISDGVEPDDFADGTDISTINPHVTLAHIDVFGRAYPAIAITDDFSTTGGLVFGLDTGESQGAAGQLRIDFTNPVAAISIDAISTSGFGQSGRLEIFDAEDNSLGVYNTVPLDSGASETMMLSRSEPDIAYAMVTGGRLDNLKFSLAEPYRITDANGQFEFLDVEPGDYVVRQVVPAGYIQTNPETGGHNLSLGAGEVGQADFVNEFIFGKITGTAYSDEDGNGEVDIGDTGMPNVKIYLDSDNDGQPTTTIEIEPDDFADGTDLSRISSDVVLSSVNFFGARGPVFAIADTLSSTGTQVFGQGTGESQGAAGQLRIDFTNPVVSVSIDAISTSGFGQAGKLEIFDAEDNSLGIYNTVSLVSGASETMVLSRSEPDIAYAMVTGGRLDNLTFSLAEPYRITDANGQFEFLDVEPGDYVVRQVVPAGYIQTNPETGGHNLSLGAGEVGQADFVNEFIFGKITGTAYSDEDGNGEVDIGDTGMPNVKIYLDSDNDGQPTTTIEIEPDDFADGTDLSRISPDVVLSSVNFFGARGPVFATADTLSSTGTQVFGRIGSTGWSSSEVLRMDFPQMASAISLDFSGDNGNFGRTGRLEIFDAEGNSLGVTNTASLLAGQSETMQFQRPEADIAYAIAGVAAFSGRFDNLVVEVPETYQLTDENGEYTFAALEQQSYIVREVVPAGYVQSSPGEDGSHQVFPIPGGTTSGLDFGNHLPPVADAGGPYVVKEGETLILDASASSDPQGDPLTVMWDVDGDGDFDENISGLTVQLDTNTLASLGLDDGPQSVTITANVSDGTYSSQASVSLTVQNVVPAIVVAGPTEFFAGNEYPLQLGAVTDPGPDTVTQWIISWGDGESDVYAPGDEVFHIYEEFGQTYTIRVNLMDEDGLHTNVGTPLSVTISEDVLERLRLDYGFYYKNTFHFNVQGQNEKYFQDRDDDWYFILPDGSIYQWQNDIQNRDEFVEQVDTAIYENPLLLIDAPPTFLRSEVKALEVLRRDHGFKYATTFYKNQSGQQEKYIQSREDIWHFIMPDGKIYEWQNDINNRDVCVGEVSPIVYDDPYLLINAEFELTEDEQEELSDLRKDFGFRFSQSYYRNTHGAFEKFIQDRDGIWYYMMPNGSIYLWEGVIDLEDESVGEAGALAYDNPDLLFNADVNPEDLDPDTLQQLKSTHGFHYVGSFHHNVHRDNEKYFQDRNGNWHFIRSDGKIYLWKGTITDRTGFVKEVSPLVYDNPHFLFNAALTLSSEQETLLNRLQTNYRFHYMGDFYFNASGQNEKYFRNLNTGAWFSITPDGSIRQYQGTAELGTLIPEQVGIEFDMSVFYENPYLLFRGNGTVSPETRETIQQLQLEYGFRFIGTYHFNANEQKEKYFQDRYGRWYSITSDGTVWRWQNGINGLGSVVANLDPTFWNEPWFLQ